MFPFRLEQAWAIGLLQQMGVQHPEVTFGLSRLSHNKGHNDGLTQLPPIHLGGQHTDRCHSQGLPGQGSVLDVHDQLSLLVQVCCVHLEQPSDSR